MNDFLKLEIMTEVAWQLGDTNGYIPHAESRHNAVKIAIELIDSGIITLDSEDIDEVVYNYLKSKGY